MRFRYIAAATFASILLIAFSCAIGWHPRCRKSPRTSCCSWGPPLAGALAVVWFFVRPRVVSYNTSITADQLAERELRTSEQKFAKAFRANPVCMAIVTVEGGRYMDVNEGYERLTGIRAARSSGAP